MKIYTIKKTIGRKTYLFDTYTLDGIETLRISRKSGNKSYVVKVYRGDLTGKIDEFINELK